MNIRRFQGWALIVSALILIYSFVEAVFLGGSGEGQNSNLYAIRGIITGIVFIVGLPAIYSTQPQIGRWGIIGLILMAIPSLTNIGWLYGYFDTFSILGFCLRCPILLSVVHSFHRFYFI